MKKILISSILIIGCLGQAWSAGADYYVADPKGPDGIAGNSDDVASSDSNPGTLAQPFATIQYAANLVGPGDTVNVKSGIYNETVIIGTSGVDGNPITFSAVPGEEVILDGQNILNHGFVSDSKSFLIIQVS